MDATLPTCLFLTSSLMRDAGRGVPPLPRALLPQIQPPNSPFPDIWCVPSSCHQCPEALFPKWLRAAPGNLWEDPGINAVLDPSPII